LAGGGGAGFLEEAREVGEMEVPGEGLAEQVEGAGEAGGGAGLFVAEGAYNNSVSGQAGGEVVETFDGPVEPGVEVGLAAVFEFEQASGEGVDAVAERKIVAEKIMPVVILLKKDGCFVQPHDLCLLSFVKLRD